MVLILLPVAHIHPELSGSVLHSSPSRQGSISHHHFPITMEASTQEGRFLVVPATFPGRQEHLTVCDRSSIRFLLQHLWAAITSQVPPSGLCRWCCWKVCWRDPWQSSMAHALIHKYRTQDIAETIAILWKIQPRAGHSPSVHWKELTLFKIHLCHNSQIFKENASQQFFIKN